jgi:hypothetical protein
MYMTATFLSLFTGSIDSNNWCCFDTLSFVIEAMAILRKVFIERMMLFWELELVVIMGKGEDAYL